MWEVYGQSDAAIIVTAESDEIADYVTSKRGDAAPTGPVTYDFEASSTCPEFIGQTNNPQWNDDYHLFFHKHEFYKFESEFRAVIFGESNGVCLPLPVEMVKEITLPPAQLPQLDPNLVERLKSQFGGLVVQPSTLCWSAPPRKIATIEGYFADKDTVKTAKMMRLAEEWCGLKPQHQTLGWNDPKGPPMTKAQGEKVVQIQKLERQLWEEIRAANKPSLARDP